MGAAQIIALIIEVANAAFPVAEHVITLGQLLFHAQTGTTPPVDLVARGMAIQRMVDAVKAADGLKQL